MKQIIAFDMDDVLADSTESLRLVVNQIYGVDLKPEHYKVPGEYWEYYERVWETHHLTATISKENLNRQMEIDQSFIRPHRAVMPVLKRLKSRYELVVVTARGDTKKQATHAWILANYPGVFTRVILGGQHNDPQQRTKGDVCAEIGAKWLIDDNISHCLAALDSGVTPILFGEYGWHMDVPKSLIRCKNWPEVGKYFDAR